MFLQDTYAFLQNPKVSQKQSPIGAGFGKSSGLYHFAIVRVSAEPNPTGQEPISHHGNAEHRLGALADLPGDGGGSCTLHP